ncbi:hypothetical protein D9758_010258 [Tetrapyrgos nigripes]|uniref:Heme haloperoxidase family profile domain-containing protein n=1 Tax=Tetrapyrgos nigripes TaxID=182062 RepID=A0A8H5GAM7_9AGAR|nr:hypothetical protein D9758_010258 [Tetrapyrgos nigripes]
MGLLPPFATLPTMIKLTGLLALVSLLPAWTTMVSAHAVYARQYDTAPTTGPSGDDHGFQAPGPNDARGPCPGLNTLANHGYLPRDGTNITIPIVLQAVLDGFNVGPDVVILAAKGALIAAETSDFFNLEEIALHETFEHDISLSREDFNVDPNNDNIHFNETVFTTLANSNPGVDYYNATSAGFVQKDRQAIQNAVNPQLINNVKGFKIRTRESSLYIAVMGNITDGVATRAPKNYVQILFREERLPIAEGWKKNELMITADMIRPIQKEIERRSEFQPSGVQPNPWIRLGPSGDIDPITANSI